MWTSWGGQRQPPHCVMGLRKVGVKTRILRGAESRWKALWQGGRVQNRRILKKDGGQAHREHGEGQYSSSPQAFRHQGQISWKAIFPWTEGGEKVSGWFQCIYFCMLYFYYYYISSTSDHQALDPRDGGPLPLETSSLYLQHLAANESDKRRFWLSMLRSIQAHRKGVGTGVG